jgi:predicted Ser/Thr protein kinase
MKNHVSDKIIIVLNVSEYYLLKEAIIDEDKEKAYQFVKNILDKKLKDIERQSCVPVFEASYKPGQKDKFMK